MISMWMAGIPKAYTTPQTVYGNGGSPGAVNRI
jgi:hypothetical protein